MVLKEVEGKNSSAPLCSFCQMKLFDELTTNNSFDVGQIDKTLDFISLSNAFNVILQKCIKNMAIPGHKPAFKDEQYPQTSQPKVSEISEILRFLLI